MLAARDFVGLRFTAQGPLNDDLGRLMSAVLKKQMRRRPCFFVGFFMGVPQPWS